MYNIKLQSSVILATEMSIVERWNALVEESGGRLPKKLKPFQINTANLLQYRQDTLVVVPTGQGKSLMQLNVARLMGGEKWVLLRELMPN